MYVSLLPPEIFLSDKRDLQKENKNYYEGW